MQNLTEEQRRAIDLANAIVAVISANAARVVIAGDDATQVAAISPNVVFNALAFVVCHFVDAYPEQADRERAIDIFVSRITNPARIPIAPEQ